MTGNDGILKTFTYGTSNAAGSRTNGRLETATRHNYVGAPFNATVSVTETYVYGARHGRASSRTTQMYFNGTPKEWFTQTWTWNALGDPGSVGYPECGAFTGCTAVTRTVSPAYTNGFLTSVPTWASEINYHPNGMVNQVKHSNNVWDTQANDPDMMRRPASISSALNGTPLWSTGTYVYDGTGNIVKTGNGYFLYDRVSRLIEGRVYDGPTGAGTQKWQSYTYDPFGNIQSIGGTSGRSTPTSSATNRLTGGTYDESGNLETWNTASYRYDGFDQMTRMTSGAEDWIYIYTAGDERFWSFRVGGGGSLWALRDLDGKVLREYEAHVSWGTFRDYIYRGKQLLASNHTTEGIRHFHLDHLGTPRLITNSGGFQTAYHVYYPFGEEATAFNQDAEQMKFTGHERDLASLAGAGDDLDYMHARFCSPMTGRFLSVDPKLRSRIAARSPQRWNRYSYGLNNPLKMVDPDGKEAMVFIIAPSSQNFPQSAFGHAAVYVTTGGKGGGISYGGDPPYFDKGIKAFVESYTRQGREVKMYVLNTTRQQDQQMLSFVEKNPEGGVNRNAAGADLMVRENCTTAVCNTLKAGGVVAGKENPGSGLMGLVDAPGALEESLETGDLSPKVSAIVIFEAEPTEDEDDKEKN